jgi:hypothetical protein
MFDLNVVEREIDGPEPIERKLQLGHETIAVVYIDPEKPEGTLVWPLARWEGLEDVVHSYVSDYLSDSDSQPTILTLEYWLNDRYYSDILDSNASVGNILSKINARVKYPSDSLELLDISSGSTIFEIVFDQEDDRPVRAALLLSVVKMQRLVELFSRHHKNKMVRNDMTIATTAFHPKDSECRNGCNILNPLRIIDEENDVEMDINTWSGGPTGCSTG